MQAIQYSWKALIALLVIGFLVADTALAIEYYHSYKPAHNNGCNNYEPGTGVYGLAGELEELLIIHDSVTLRTTWQWTFKACQGILPDSFWVAINDGPNPKGHAGELAMAYFDARSSSIQQYGTPIVTAYAYNGENGLSFIDGVANGGPYGVPGNQPPDRIGSNHPLAADNGMVISASRTENADGTRTLTMVLDGSVIRNHPNLYSDPDPVDPQPWYGIDMDEYVGFWAHPMQGGTIEYCGEGELGPVCGNICTAAGVPDAACTKAAAIQSGAGFIKTGSYDIKGFYDQANCLTNQAPNCVTTISSGVLKSDTKQAMLHADMMKVDMLKAIADIYDSKKACYEVEVGEKFSSHIRATDADDADNDQLLVTVEGAPAGMSIINKSSNDPLVSGSLYPQPAEFSLSWVPDTSNYGEQYSVQFVIADEYIQGLTQTQCGFELCVPENKAPTCDLTVTTGNGAPSCTGLNTEVNVSSAGSSDPEQDELKYDYTVTCVDMDSNEVTESFTTSDAGVAFNLMQPGLGNSVSCSVELQLSDGYNDPVSCQTEFLIEGCPIDCEGTPFGDKVLDPCGVCGGDGSSCADCLGNPNGDAIFDECGVCNGDGSSCADCLGNPNGDAVVDECGVCDGNGSSCADCLGNPNGDAIVDDCGVCNGDGSSCADCLGNPNGEAQEDQCGVCQGDGTSCLGCEESSITGLLTEIDGTAQGMASVNSRLARSGKKALNKAGLLTKRISRKLSRLDAQSQAASDSSWTTAWSFPQTSVQCVNTVLCVSFDLSTEQNELSEQVDLFVSVNRKMRRIITRALGRKNFGKKLAKQITSLSTAMDLGISNLPTVQSQCSLAS